MIKALLLFFLLIVQVNSLPYSSPDTARQQAAFQEKKWVDSIFNSLTTDQKIGQLFMIRAHSNLGPEHIAEVERQIRKYQVGGLCFFQGTPLKQAELTNKYQTLSKIPLMVAIDAEWGLGMRFKESAISFPRQLTLGALQEDKLIYDMGVEIARQLKRIGTHVNFAPVADINVNPANPVINDRSFGENRVAVTSKSFQYMMGMQDMGVMACAKHFPGHGDTDVDSHLDLPVINHNRARLDSIELFPFRLLFEQGMQSVMVAHLQVPSLEPDPRTPTSLSSSTMTDLIKNEYGYQGLIFSDALEMKGVTKNFTPGALEVVAFKAGCDILCLPDSIDLSFEELKKAVAAEAPLKLQLDEAVRKILHAKYKMGLNAYSPVSLEKLTDEVNSPKAIALKSKLYEQALTLVANKNKLIPLTELDQHKLASVSIGATEKSPFQWRMDSYAKVSHQQTELNIPEAKAAALLNSLKGKDIVIVSLHGLSKQLKQNFSLSPGTLNFIKMLEQQSRVILVSFGSPYALRNFETSSWVLQAYEEDPQMQDLAAQAIFGAIGCKGRLPVNSGPAFPAGSGLDSESLMRFGFTIPERVGLNHKLLGSLDSLCHEIVNVHAAPGGQLLVARKGKVVYHKAFGYHDYEKKTSVRTDDLYDLASITKVAASTLAVMRLYDEGKIDLDQPMSEYLPDLKGTNKSRATLTEIMSHQAGFKAWIPFYKETLLRVKRHVYKPDPALYASANSSKYSLPVAQGMFLKTGYDHLIWKSILESSLRENNNYVYSDLGFYMIAQMIRYQTGMRIDQFVNKYFYKPLGLTHTLYNPYQSFPLQKIAPTEKDNYWRNRVIRGYVHDMGAAMLDGVSGHAGLFSNAYELGTLFQMLLNGGRYGGDHLIRSATISQFASRQLGSTRRGIGFDMKELNTEKTQPAGQFCSPNTFGHTGFTGTSAWVDPDQELVFVFLCNRTYPSMENNKLHKMEYRTRLLDAVYLAMEEERIPLDNTMQLGQ
ncbi:MAG TPA: glycoside hydrolase family 3 N-terminal domain-containing protein [Saprospiraceae bacterium]|nr:glycoside hydrolase family 3 N-terminal domain-containing protein [Saprospiraceae bacterium]HNT21934.1 glycoside hydrolase family 3 N-terminal domain-containing protein [Saprospiraceae bacterium]